MSQAGAQVLLLAHPAGHSLSPLMQNAAFEAAGVAASYRAVDVPPASLRQALNELRDESYLGANVTVPHKEAVARLVDELTPAAEASGAVNTVVRQGRRLLGHNTDGAGFLAGLAELGGDMSGAPARLEGRTALVLGAGGAARAVVHALTSAGARVLVANRDAGRAQRLVADLRAGRAVGAQGASELRGVDLLINSTSVGMSGGPDPAGIPLLSAADLKKLPPGAWVVDLVYRPALTPLLLAAQRHELVVQNGLPMLIWQGALAFQEWTGLPAPVTAMRLAAERGLADGPD